MENITFQVMDLRRINPRRVSFTLRVHVSDSDFMDLRRCSLVTRDDRPLSDPDAARGATFYASSRQDLAGDSHEVVGIPYRWKSLVRAEVLRTLDVVR